MVKIEKTLVGDALTVKISGELTESDDLAKELGSVPAKLTVNCEAIKRINSSGVLAWFKCFDEISKKGTKISFSRCSVAIVEQLNINKNFSCGGDIESVFLPYRCNTCLQEFSKPIEVEQVRKMKMENKLEKLAVTICINCGERDASFDDVPEFFFQFLE